jgi:hypothetical protein
VPQRLVELLGAIRQEQDPAVRGRAAALLLADLASAAAEAQQLLDDAVRDLRRAGHDGGHIATMLDVPMPRLRLAREP